MVTIDEMARGTTETLIGKTAAGATRSTDLAFLVGNGKFQGVATSEAFIGVTTGSAARPALKAFSSIVVELCN